MVTTMKKMMRGWAGGFCIGVIIGISATRCLLVFWGKDCQPSMPTAHYTTIFSRPSVSDGSTSNNEATTSPPKSAPSDNAMNITSAGLLNNSDDDATIISSMIRAVSFGKPRTATTVHFNIV